MTIVKKYCDCCRKEVNWLYKMPYLMLQGNVINIYERGDSRELCKECAEKVIKKYNKWNPSEGDENG